MPHVLCPLTALFLLTLSGPARATETSVTPITATIETTLKTAKEQIRQYAFDGDADTHFLSAQHPGPQDHFTLVFTKPVQVQAIRVTTGLANGEHRLTTGVLEGSADGTTFTPLATFTDGKAESKSDGTLLQAVRIKPTAEMKHPLALREIVVTSTPALAVFRYPVEFFVDVTDAPEMKDWAEKVARLCEQQYPLICEELRSDGYKPPRWVVLTLKSDYNGVAMASGGRITGSVRFFKNHPEDVGAMVHETVHVVQRYRHRNNPGWLVEGIADYYRFFKFEPGKIGRINPDRARYNGSYRTSAAFLAFLTQKYDKEIVRKLNQIMREGKYKEDVFKELTGKSVQDLDAEWRATLRKGG